jgi:hypothetical protein
MTALPIRRMILYKHGVGFFERRGTLDGQAVQLTFRRDEINDALKSLTVIDRAGGQVLGVHYETPEDKDARLADSSIALTPDHSLLDLLRSLRGRAVRLGLVDGERTGRLLGVDVDEEAPLEKSAVVLLDDDGHTVVTFPAATLRTVALRDERAAHDLGFFLDTSMSEEVRRSVTVRLSPGAHDLSAFYIAPSPTWRVSYRVVAEREKPGAERGKLLLQGWGLFDNRLDEDLEDAQVTLVAGMPISFVYDLATSRIPARPVVEDQARVAAAPVEFEEAYAAAEAAPQMEAAMAKMAAPAPAARPAGAGMGISMDHLAATPAQAQASDLGELFEYAVTTPVSVKRGESAMVPIIGVTLDYARELLYNGRKLPTHPVVAARFANAGGLTLERGPVTVVEDGDYRGEAIVPFTKAGGEVYLAFAVELGVKVTENAATSSAMASLHVQNAYLRIEEWYTERTTYTLANSTGQALTITIEKPKQPDYQPIDTLKPDAETADHRRWRVTCAPRAQTEFVVQERTLRSRWDQVLNQSYDQLRWYLDNKWLDKEMHGRLKALLDERAQIAANNEETARLQAERNEIYARQEQIRKNMQVMAKDNTEEVDLRKRLRVQLEQSEDRLAAIDKRLAELKADSAAREQRVQEELKRLS